MCWCLNFMRNHVSRFIKNNNQKKIKKKIEQTNRQAIHLSTFRAPNSRHSTTWPEEMDCYGTP